MSSSSFLEAHGKADLSSVLSAAFLLGCMSLGVGVFMMPTIFNSVGWPAGTAMILFFGMFSTLIMLLVLDIADERDCQTAEQFAGLVPGCRFLSTLGMCVTMIIGNAAHFQVISGMFFDLMEWFVTDDYGHHDFLHTKKVFLLLIFLSIALPWTFQSDLGGLRHIGTIVSGIIMVTSAVVIVFALLHSKAGGDTATPFAAKSLESFITAAPTVCFAFSGNFNLFEIFSAMRHGAPAEALLRTRHAVLLSGALVTSLYLVVGLTCVWAFGIEAGVERKGSGYGNVLYNFPADNYLVTFLCGALVVGIILDYPIINFPLVNTVLRFPFRCMDWEYARHALSVAFAVVVIGVDMGVKDLPDVFGLCGALGISNFCYIVPGLVLLRTGRGLGARIVGGVSLLTGLCMLFGGTFFIIKNIITGQ